MDHSILKRVIYDNHELIRNFKIIDRDIVLEKDINYVLVGLRRSGKSTLLFKRVQDRIKDGVNWNQIIYINFDDERLAEFNITDFDDIIQVANELTTEEHYFFFDEIQNIDGWEKFAIRMANSKYKVDITGSNAKMLSKEVNAALGGRYISKEVTPYNFHEFLKASNIDSTDMSNKNTATINAALDSYLYNGGFPETVNYLNKREYVSNIYQKILLGDVITHNGIRNINGIKLLIKKIAESICQGISYTKLQNLITGVGYKISKDMVIDYVQFCRDSFLLFDVENYYGSFLDKVSTPKHYFIDNGVLNLFLINKDSLLLENIVATHLYKKHFQNVFYLKGDKFDIDFYVPDTNDAIQVAYSIDDVSSLDREINNLLKCKKEFNDANLMLITRSTDKEIKIDNFTIKVISLKNFLLNY